MICFSFKQVNNKQNGKLPTLCLVCQCKWPLTEGYEFIPYVIISLPFIYNL